MIAEIITVGTEVVMGNTINTNSLFLAQQLTELGIEVHFHTSVDDEDLRLKSVIKIALSRADLIITTGGLGPTKDDMTKEVISDVLKLDMDLDKDMENNIINMFNNGKWNMTKNNQKQAYKPKSSKFITNEIGTAPGIYIEANSKKIIMLPGPPIEMELMFKNYVVNLIKEDLNILSRSINIVGFGESSLESKLNELNLNTYNTSVLTFAKEGIVEIKIISKGNDIELIKEEIKTRVKIIEENFKDYIYGYDNISLENVIVNLLTDKNLKLGLCESITGGMISSNITKVPGASKVFDRGIVSYSNKSKIEELKVKQETLDLYGPVSSQTAREMARGLFEKSDIDIALSITGFAGPEAEDNKPVGLVYIGLVTKNTEEVFEFNFNGNRNLIQIRATVKALDQIRKLLK